MAEENEVTITPAGNQVQPSAPQDRLPRELRVMFGLPAYGRIIYVNCAMGLANSVAALASRKVPYRMHSISDAIIGRSRNSIVAEFLADDKNWTHLVMIDSDVGFDPRNLFRMIAFDKDVVGIALPKRQYDTAAFPKEGVKDWNEAEAYLSVFTSDIELDNGKMRAQSGFVKARNVATALMVVKRQVFETMIAKGAVQKITPDVATAPDRVEKFYGFFETMVDPQTRTYVGEDFAFCRRWRDCGGEIWCDIQGEYTHTGAHDFKGNLLRSIQARGGKIERNAANPPAVTNG